MDTWPPPSGLAALISRVAIGAGLGLLLALAARAPATAQAPREEPCSALRALSLEEREALQSGALHVTLEAQPNRRIKKGSAIRQVRASASELARVLSDHEQLATVLRSVRSAEVVSVEATATLVRQVLDLPFPLRNRHYTIRISDSEAKNCYQSSWSYVRGSGNINDTTGRWEVLEIEPGTSLLAYLVAADPGGMVPAWAANWAAKRALPGVVHDVASAAESRAGHLRPSRAPDD